MPVIIDQGKFTMHDYMTRESGVEHHNVGHEAQICRLLQEGNMDAVELCQSFFWVARRGPPRK